MGEPLKDKDMIRGVIVNADEYKSDDVLSQDKIEEMWVNLNGLKSAVGWLEEEIKILSPKHRPKVKWERNCYCKACVKIREIKEKIDQAFPDLEKKGEWMMEKTAKQIKDYRDRKFRNSWKDFVDKINSGKKPFILRLFGSKYPVSKLDIRIAKFFYREGFYIGNMYMSKQIDLVETNKGE